MLSLPRLASFVEIATAKKTLGSLGAVVELPDGTFGAVTAGHVVRMASGAELFAKTATSQLSLGSPIVTLYDDVLDVDLALLGPIAGDVAAISSEVVFVRDPNTSDINTRFAVQKAGNFLPTLAWVHQVQVTTDFHRVDRSGVIRLEGLVSVDDVTDPGDSGAPALDDRDNLVGFVVGSDGLRTYLMPAERGLYELANRLP